MSDTRRTHVGDERDRIDSVDSSAASVRSDAVPRVTRRDTEWGDGNRYDEAHKTNEKPIERPPSTRMCR